MKWCSVSPKRNGHLVTVDPQAQVALSMFGEAQKLTELARSNGKKAH